MNEPLRILLLEDSPTDAELSERLLRKAGIAFTSLRVESREAFVAALDEFRPDLILADYKLPGFDGLQALDIVRQHAPDMPYIFVTGAMGEDWAVEVLRQDATDYVLKDRLAHLPTAVERALAEKEARSRQRDAEQQFARFMEFIPALTYIKDSDGRVLYANPLLEALIGTKDWNNKRTSELFPGPLGLDMERNDRQALAQGYLHVEENVRQPDDSLRYFETHKFSIARQSASPLLGGITLDITERKQAEVALRDQSAFLMSLLESIPVAVFYKDTQGRYLGCNRDFEELTGMSQAEIVGKSVFDMVPPEIAKQYHATDTALLQQPGKQVYEWLIRKPSGELRNVMFHKAAFLRSDGSVGGLIGAVLDITETKQLQEQTHRLQLEQQALLDHAQVGIAHTKQRRIVSYNRRFAELFGYGVNELIDELTEKVYVSHETFVAFGVRAYAALAENGSYKEELTLRRKDGSLFWAALVGRAIDPAQPLEGSIWICVDISERKQAELQLQESEQRYRTLADSGQALIWTSGTDKLCNYFNQIWLNFTGRSLEQELGNGWAEGVHPDDFQRCLDAYMSAFDRREKFSIDYRLRRHDGEYCWIQDDGCPRYNSQEEFIGYIGHCLDITERKQMQLELATSEQRFRGAMESVRDAFIIIEAEHGAVLTWNSAAETIFGYRREEMIGQQLHQILSPPHLREELVRGLKYFAGAGNGAAIDKMLELTALHKYGKEIPIELSLTPMQLDNKWYITCVARDIRERKHYLAQLERQSNYDDLTGLPNRNLLTDRLSQAIAHSRRYEKKLALLAFNLDRFKEISDSLGFVTGDELLRKVAERIRYRLRNEDTLAHFSEDEFVILQEQVINIQEAAMLARDVLATTSAPFTLDSGQEIFLSASIGISLYPNDADSADVLLRNADAALYQAKKNGNNQFCYFTQDMNAKALAALEMEAWLRRALERDELILHYQPQVDLQTGKIYGAEALLRWQHNGQGFIPPLQFIPLAEKTDLIISIGNWVIDAACRQICAWRGVGLRNIQIGVNISTRQFQSGDLPTVISQALTRYAVEPACLVLELTESMLMAQPDKSIALLQNLKQIGVKISLDDFGTGYSSLAYLSRFPIDTLKIDQSFVCNIATEPTAAAIVTSIIGLAHRLKLRVVAEGVETDTQLGYLRMNQCDEMQGYNFSEPLSADDFSSLLRQEKSITAASDQADTNARTILAVDDEVNILSALRRMLHRDGYRILTASSAREGLEILAQNPVQVILSDQRMPEMNGTEFLRRVKELYPDTVRIVLSGYTDLESVTQLINEGALYKFLTKPWEDDQLREQIRDAFRYYDAVIKPRKPA